MTSATPRLAQVWASRTFRVILGAGALASAIAALLALLPEANPHDDVQIAPPTAVTQSLSHYRAFVRHVQDNSESFGGGVVVVAESAPRVLANITGADGATMSSQRRGPDDTGATAEETGPTPDDTETTPDDTETTPDDTRRPRTTPRRHPTTRHGAQLASSHRLSDQGPRCSTRTCPSFSRQGKRSGGSITTSGGSSASPSPSLRTSISGPAGTRSPAPATASCRWSRVRSSTPRGTRYLPTLLLVVSSGCFGRRGGRSSAASECQTGCW